MPRISGVLFVTLRAKCEAKDKTEENKDGEEYVLVIKFGELVSNDA